MTVLLYMLMNRRMFQVRQLNKSSHPTKFEKREATIMKRLISFGVAIFFLFCGTVSAGEQVSTETLDTLKRGAKKLFEGGGIGLGPEKLWRITPGFKYSTMYHSNINREPHNNQDHDIIMQFVPSVGLSRIGSKFGVLSDYEMNYQLFLRDSDQTSFNHRFKTKTWYESERLKLKLSENFGWAKTFATTEQSERRTVISNDVSPEAIYHLGSKVSISSIYQNYLFHYKDTVLEDNSYIRNDIGGRVYYHVTNKTDLFLQGSVIFTDYYQSSEEKFDSQGYGIYGGAIGEVTDKTVVNLKTGFESRDYDNGSINSFDNWVGELGLRYSLTAKTDATLLAKRGIEESIYGNTGWYSFNKVALGFVYQLTHNIVAELTGGYQHNRYPRETMEGPILKKRRDHTITAEYKVKWEPIQNVALAAGYVYGTRIANFDEFDYIEHSVEASTALKF